MPLIDIQTLPETSILTRDPSAYLEEIWQSYFSDILRVNTVEITYSYPWKRRLGLIRLSLDTLTSFIGLNALLQVSEVPDYVLITTIAHELAHYAHGFGSPLTRRFEHPHANNVVTDELERRGLGATMRLCDAWIDRHWFAFYDREHETGWASLPSPARSTRGRRKTQV